MINKSDPGLAPTPGLEKLDTAAFSELCAHMEVSRDHKPLLQSLKELLPEHKFHYATGRSGWHRIGGIVDVNHHRVARNIREWVENIHDSDLETILDLCADKPMFATRLQGTTHYFVAQIGNLAQDFVQLEIESLQEVICRPLTDPDWLPDDVEEFIDPLDFPELEAEPIAPPRYQFRRIISVPELVSSPEKLDRGSRNILRFFENWNLSSAVGAGAFSDFWVLGLREFTSGNREQKFMARFININTDQLSALPKRGNLRGVELAKALHDFDRRMGYPFAWYFFMLAAKNAPHELAEAVLRDQMGAYDYLPAKDLKLLREWEQRPFSV